jgi:hypothetical protein
MRSAKSDPVAIFVTRLRGEENFFGYFSLLKKTFLS